MADSGQASATGGADERDSLFSDEEARRQTETSGDAQAKGGLFGDEEGELAGSPPKRQAPAVPSPFSAMGHDDDTADLFNTAAPARKTKTTLPSKDHDDMLDGPLAAVSATENALEAIAGIESDEAPRDVLGFDSMFSGALHDSTKGVHGKEKALEELVREAELSRPQDEDNVFARVFHAHTSSDEEAGEEEEIGGAVHMSEEEEREDPVSSPTIAHAEHTQPSGTEKQLHQIAEPEDLVLPAAQYEDGSISPEERLDRASEPGSMHDTTPNSAPEDLPAIHTDDASLDTPTRHPHSPVPSPAPAHTIHNDAAQKEDSNPPIPEAPTAPQGRASATQLDIHSVHDTYGETGRPSSPPAVSSSGTPPPAPARTDIGDVAARVIEAKLRKTEALVAVLMEEINAAESELAVKDEVIALLAKKLDRRGHNTPQGTPAGEADKSALARRIALLEEAVASKESESVHSREMLSTAQARLHEALTVMTASGDEAKASMGKQLLLAEEVEQAQQSQLAFTQEELGKVRRQLADELRRKSVK